MIYLRELKEKDAPLMLEWMHSEETKHFFRKNMQSITLEQAVAFCKNAEIPLEMQDGMNLHLAIVDEQDEYLGTISLKDFNTSVKSAEYAISMRAKACGKGIAFQATKEILRKGFKEYGLHRIYLNVLADNVRAVHFYEKCGFLYEGEFRDCLLLDHKYASLKFFGMLEQDYKLLSEEE